MFTKRTIIRPRRSLLRGFNKLVFTIISCARYLDNAKTSHNSTRFRENNNLIFRAEYIRTCYNLIEIFNEYVSLCFVT